ncbi:MAG TPA: hypothetical protein VEP91_07450 [Solirubrobacterales bacterium]|nr:hypothetical protein [Solirubrobacterales bacterium]
MRRRLALCALLAATLGGSVLFPAFAGAAHPRVHHRIAASPVKLLPPLPPSHLLSQHGEPVAPTPFFRSGFVLKADGYKIGVSTFGSAVFLEVWRGGSGRRVQTAYLARGVARPERLQATFGSFGKVKMRFREARNRSWRGRVRTCRGANRFIKRRGVFRGNLRFKGEGGYVSIRIHRAKGAVVTEAPKCRRHRGGGGFDIPFASFSQPKSAVLAIARQGVDATAFLGVEDRRSTLFFAAREESRGKLAIVRMAVLRRRSPIHTNEALTSAHLSPPAPFHGTGRYRAAADGTSVWSGGLSVNFPGKPRYPLTGPEYETFLEVPF